MLYGDSGEEAVALRGSGPGGRHISLQGGSRDDDWDWGWPVEPEITYRHAIDRLRILIQGRELTFVSTGTGAGAPGRCEDRLHRSHRDRRASGAVRISQPDGTAIHSPSLLADRHALWYRRDQVITARLVGKYDQFHAGVARALVPK